VIDADVLAPARSATFHLQNKGSRPLNAQVRLFRWSLENGQDRLTPTSDVMATPPIVEIGPGKTFTIRVVRRASTEVTGEEPYRLVVDELPEGGNAARLGINVAVRYVIPIFFSSRDAQEKKLQWSIRTINGRPHLAANNPGDVRVQVADLRLGGKLVSKGLAGYVLGRTTKIWALPDGVPATGPVSGMSSRGAIQAEVATDKR
jgi:fimbrial chaperone protein